MLQRHSNVTTVIGLAFRMVIATTYKFKTSKSNISKTLKEIVSIALTILLIFTISYVHNLLRPQVADRSLPNVVITSKDTHFDFDPYVMWIDVTVHNNGSSGTAIVWAEVTQDSTILKKNATIYLNSNESRDLTFEFRVSLWSPLDWRVWAIVP